MTRGRHGFSLVETLIVIAIMGLLFGLLAAAVLRVRGHVARTRCADAMRQLALALHQYEALHGGLPKGITVAPARPPMRYVSWLTRLTPQLGRDDIWNAARAAYSLSPGFVMEEPHLNLLKTPMSVFRCPADPRNGNGRFGRFEVAFTNYLGCSGTDQYAKDGVLYVDSGVRATDVHDGLSHTILMSGRSAAITAATGGGTRGTARTTTGRRSSFSACAKIGSSRRSACVIPLRTDFATDGRMSPATTCISGATTFTALTWPLLTARFIS